VHVPWKAGLIALWMKRKYGRNFMITEHWGIYNEVVEDNFYTKPKLNRALLKNLFKEAKALVSVSDFLGKGVERISGKKTDMIIPNVVDTALFFYKQEKYSKFTFIHVSNMVPLKNVKAILDAFKIMSQATGKDVQLILIGNRNNEYPEYADQLGLLNSSVFFRGEITYAEVAKEMQHSHCFVLNSNMENSPCVISEALCCGLPVIATNVGGVGELINNNNGYLISSGDNEALVSAMEDICNNYSLFNQKQISEEATQKFSYSSIAKKFDELYRKFC
jgi:glycosyltransferase involved in cell wall biosynthesis